MAVPSILLLPDDPLSGLRAVSNLQTFGYDLLVASSPPEALSLLAAQPRIGVLVVGADLVTRTVLPQALPVGILTAAIGAPYLLWLLVRGRRRSTL